MVDLSLLTSLEQMLHEAKQFSDIWDYFLAHFGENREFIALGERADDEVLEQVLQQVGRQLFGREVRVREMRLKRIPEYRFLHGSVLLEGKLASVIYFEEPQKGVLAVFWGSPASKVKYVRFTGRALYDGLNRSSN